MATLSHRGSRLTFRNKTGCTAPPLLKRGDKAAIVAPASSVNEKALEAALQKLKEWELEPVVYPPVCSPGSFFSGTDAERARAFQQALDDPAIRVIFCARGGYGSIRILPLLQFRNFLNHPKWIIGFSDVTAFHSYLTHHLCVQSIHAPMAIHFEKYETLKDAFDKLKHFLFEGELSYALPPHPFNRHGTAEGILTGGNLSVLYSLRGTPADLHPHHHILFLEDVDEYLYHIDRMLINFKYGGWLKGLKGMIIGTFSEMKEKQTPFGKQIEEIFSEATKEYSYPVLFGFPAGHGGENFPLVMGRKVRITMDEKQTLVNFIS